MRTEALGAPALPSPSPLAIQVTTALAAHGFITTGALAAHLGVGRDRIVATYDEIEAAGIKLLRVRGPVGGAEIDDAAQPEPMLPHAIRPRPIRAASAIAGLPARPVPGQPAFLAKRMRRRMAGPSLADIADRLAELGVRTAADPAATGRALEAVGAEMVRLETGAA